MQAIVDSESLIFTATCRQPGKLSNSSLLCGWLSSVFSVPSVPKRVLRRAMHVGYPCWVEVLDSLTGGVTGGPGPLEVVAAEVAGDVNDFADEIQARLLSRFQRLR